MKSAKRKHHSLMQRLLDEPYRFEFFQAVRILEHWYRKKHPDTAHGDVVFNHILFRNTLSLSFPPSEIILITGKDKQGVRYTAKEGEPLSLHIDILDKIEITPAFFGLLGVQGALPYSFTEMIAEREYSLRDTAAREFLDILTNRATALFYASWKKYRLPIQVETNRRAHFMPQLLALAGMGHPALQTCLAKVGMPEPTKDTTTVDDADTGIYDESIAYYAAAFMQRPISPSYLQQVLSDYFKVKVAIDPLVGKWYDIPKEERTILGEKRNQLGLNMHLGSRTWQHGWRMIIRIGPLSQSELDTFLPKGKKARAFRQFLMIIATNLLVEFEVRLILRKEDVRTMQLGRGFRLGYGTFLKAASEQQDREVVRFEVGTIE